ncbi:unnamed protein product [Durusdinium trenchii]|uniref:Poly [ADP-ribose] polymerase n=2 Tax=Durusdinium trenchii TaxID=1381693 RepID=A0ABP0RRF8_9DINO
MTGQAAFYEVRQISLLFFAFLFLPASSTNRGVCYPDDSIQSSSNYQCQAFSYCRNQNRAINKGTMTLASCMDECDRINCESIQFDCNTDCFLLEEGCGQLIPTSCGSSVYHRVTTTTTTTTTRASNCFPGIPGMLGGEPGFQCASFSYCGNEHDAHKLGRMSLAACLAQCNEQANCRAVQYDCGTECWLLPSCETLLPDNWCGSSTYLKETTLTTTELGRCWPNNVTSMDDFRCTSGRYCAEQAFGTNYSDMSLEQCAALCQAKGCSYIQYDCNKACILLASCTPIPTDCGSSIYYRTANNLHYTAQPYGAGRYVVHSAACDSCTMQADCPWGTSPIGCEMIPPGRHGRVLEVTGQSCKARPSTSTDFGLAEVICSSQMETFSKYNRFSERNLCGDGAALACYCTQSQANCQQLPTSSFGEPARCALGQWALCWEGEESYTIKNVGYIALANSLSWCGWANLQQRDDADCRHVMQEHSDEHVGGCRSNECIDLADCVQKCEACNSCTGVLYFPREQGLDEYSNNMRCYMQRSNVTGSISAQGPTMNQPSVYVNSRNAGCSIDHSIKGIRFFRDSDCIDPVYPTSIADHNGHVLPSSWLKYPGAYQPCTHCSNIAFTARFDSATPVLCAVVHSTPGFEQGWELYAGTGDHPIATSKQGAAVTYNKVDFVAGSTVVFTGSLTVRYEGEFSTASLAVALAKLLLLPLHTVQLQRSRRLSTRRVQTLSERCDYSIQFLDSTGTLHKSVEATLKVLQSDPGQLNMPLLFNLQIAITDMTEMQREIIPSTSTTTTMTPLSFQLVRKHEWDESPDLASQVFTALGVSLAVVGGPVVLWKLYQFLRQGPQHHPKTSSGIIIGALRTTRCETEEDLQPLTPTAAQSLPSYWSTTGIEVDFSNPLDRRKLAFEELAYVKHEHLQQFQNLVNHTYKAIPTQDRLCPTGMHGKVRGGCPCVQPGGKPGLPTGFQVKRVIRVEDSDMFNRYIFRRDTIKATRGKCDAPGSSFLTHEAIDKFQGLKEIVASLDLELNEAYLWHGTQVRTGLQIAQEDFNMAFAGSGAGTMYGKGLYFSESCTKADEYSRDEPRGYYDSVRALLLCRVCMGQFYYTADRESSAIEKYLSGVSDSTLGDRASAVGTYREFVVYHPDQVYPEYLVLYERLHGTRPPEPPPKDMPFLLELPLYWKNVGKNPRIQEFREHWQVKQKITKLIYRMALHTSENMCPKVQRVKRVEDSVLWCKYMNWKKQLSQELSKRKIDRCKPPNELDGNPNSGHVLTGEIQAEHDGDEAISLENMVPGLNELLLWHGTSREAAAAIASDGFILNPSALHGRRFGNGVYLAEDLRKSMSYCKESEGVLHVLLCRAVCGEIFYTEKDRHVDAPDEAKAAKKQSVLANPGKVGPREYILFETAQVYPEYIVEFVTRMTE